MLHCCFPLVPIAWRRARQSPSPDYLDQHFVCDCLARHNHEESLLEQSDYGLLSFVASLVCATTRSHHFPIHQRVSGALGQPCSCKNSGGRGDWLKSKLSSMSFALRSLSVSDERPNLCSTNVRNEENS